MKEKLLFVMLLVAMAISSCVNDDPEPISLVGTWYEENQNEEFRFSAGNTFYAKFCFKERAYECEGIYEADSKNMRLSLTYTYMGQNQYLDWKLVSIDNCGFDMSSQSAGSHHYYKVVDTFTFKEGSSLLPTANNTAEITSSTNLPSSEIISYSCLNENIATVSSDGKITTKGEKGTAYIKVKTSVGTVVVKVIVGLDRYDLWIDYCNLLGKDVSAVRTLLGSPSQTAEDVYAYVLEMHDIIDYVLVFLDSKTKKVDQVELHFLENVPSADILSYVKDKYYFFENNGNQLWYMTSPEIDDSRAVVAYFQNENIVVMTSADPYKSRRHYILD